MIDLCKFIGPSWQDDNEWIGHMFENFANKMSTTFKLIRLTLVHPVFWCVFCVCDPIHVYAWPLQSCKSLCYRESINSIYDYDWSRFIFIFIFIWWVFNIYELFVLNSYSEMNTAKALSQICDSHLMTTILTGSRTTDTSIYGILRKVSENSTHIYWTSNRIQNYQSSIN